MKITVRYLAQLKAAAGRGSEEVQLINPCSALQTLAHLAGQHGDQLRRLLLTPEGEVRRTVLIFVGDEQVPAGQDVLLKDGDSLTLLLPVAGGSGLSPEEAARYAWQLDVPGFGAAGQERLKDASVLVSRCGGVGGLVAYQLAAAGVGRLVLAHGGDLRPDDLNRQLLMTQDHVGRPRMDLIPERLRQLNPLVQVEPVPENVNEENVANLVGQVDAVVSCAPLFDERLLMNREAVRQGKPLVDCAMYELELQLTTVLPGWSPCLACLYPEPPPEWKRRFPVFGAVAGTVGCLGAMEVIKVLAGLGDPLAGKLLLADLRDMSFRTVKIQRNPTCTVCASPRPA